MITNRFFQIQSALGLSGKVLSFGKFILALSILSLLLALGACAERPSPSDHKGIPFWPKELQPPKSAPKPVKPASAINGIPFEEVKSKSVSGRFLGQPWIFETGSAWNFFGDVEEFQLELWDSGSGGDCSFQSPSERRILFNVPLTPAEYDLAANEAQGVAFVLADENRPDVAHGDGRVRIYGVHDGHVYGYISARVDSESWVEGYFSIPVCDP